MTNSSRVTRRAVYPGSFDPVTNGHTSLIERACGLVDELIVAVARSDSKTPMFSFEERIDLMERTVSTLDVKDQIKVVGFDGLLAKFAIEQKANAIIRGLRAVSDFEYEFQMALMNRKLAREVETVFLMPALSWVYLSSSIVRDVATHGGDISGLVPPQVAAAIKQKLQSNK
ncbi:MAG: pantetheine-phosphate adenylyltransferase [Candidatus Zixiibacteriota bacterium]|nr:MAG: pantetheine-phosphate adenylyltransferase [candidate division Zixibacteria bacterium]